MARYSQELVDKVNELYPNDTELRRLVDEGDPRVWGILHKRFLPHLELTSLVNRDPLIRDAVAAKS